jgi:hypothetical protein
MEESGDDYNFRPSHSSDDLAASSEQIEEDDPNLLSTSGWFFHGIATTSDLPRSNQRKQRPEPLASANNIEDVDTPFPFLDLNVPIPFPDLNEPCFDVEPHSQRLDVSEIQTSEAQLSSNARPRRAPVMMNSRANSVDGNHGARQRQPNAHAAAAFPCEIDREAVAPLRTTARHPDRPSTQAARGRHSRTFRLIPAEDEVEAIQPGRTRVRQREGTDVLDDRDQKRSRC